MTKKVVDITPTIGYINITFSTKEIEETMSTKEKPKFDVDNIRYQIEELANQIKRYDNEVATADGTVGFFKIVPGVNRWGRKVTYLDFYHRQTVRMFNNVFRFEEHTEDGGYRTTLAMIKSYYTKFLKMAEDEEKKPYFEPIIKFLEEKMALQLESYKNNLEHGQVAFDDLWLMFNDGKEVFFEDAEVAIGAVIEEAKFIQTWGGTLFMVRAEYIGSNGDKFYSATKSASIAPYEGTRSIDSLPIRLIDNDFKASLTERGKKYVGLASGAHYMHYNGELLYRTWMGNRYYTANGRCMVDVRMFRAQNSNYDRSHHDEDTETENVEYDDLWRVTPWIRGFSFPIKQWGEINVENIENIKFDSNAFDRLVLPARKVGGIEIDPKTMIQSLVEEGNTGFTDVISGKGGGCIFLLHGPPGTGKTLTAEAVAELLQRPLYSVSVGELGTQTDALEERLRKVLELATTWNAVVLIDEADIFLEERTVQDVERNALVAVFLRMLEYYQGVMFLTTNRVNNFDRAFHSRISIALNYAKLPASSRTQVWNNLLDAANIENLDVKKLSSYDINGRQIKNAIRIALSLGKSNGRDVTTSDVEQVIHLAEEFNTTLNAIKENADEAKEQGII